jgi:hypothetical protein
VGFGFLGSVGQVKWMLLSKALPGKPWFERILTNAKYDDILDKDAILSSLLLVTISPALLMEASH